MKKRILSAAAASALLLTCLPGYAQETSVYRADIEITDADKSFTIALAGDTEGITIASDGGAVTVNGTAANGVCGESSRWYITVGEADGKFNVVLDGKSIYTGQSKITGTECTVADADSHTIVSFGKIPRTSAEITSERLTVSGNTITGVTALTAGEVVNALEISGNASAKIFSKNGVVRSGRLRAGDYLICTDMLGSTEKYTFPEIDLGGMRSEFFGLDFEKMTVTNLPQGLTAEQLKGAIQSDTDFTVSQSGNKMTITVGNNTYTLTAKINPPETAQLYCSDCEDNDYLNRSSSALTVGTVYTDAAHGKSLSISPEQSSSNGKIQYALKNPGSVLAVYNDIKYSFENPSAHYRQFNAPIISGGEESIYVRERRGELVYRTVVGSNADDVKLNISSENDVWHNIGMIVNTSDSTYSVYYDGEKKAEAQIPSGLTSAECLSYTTNQTGQYELGTMYIDNIAVFRPFVQLGAIKYKNGAASAWSSEALERIGEIQLIFSKADYSRIKTSAIAGAVTVTDADGAAVGFSSSAEDNCLTLTLDKAIGEGEYKITLTNPQTVYGADGGSYEYGFSVGKKINHVDASLNGSTVLAEVELSNNALLSGGRVLLAVYDKDMHLCAADEKIITAADGNIPFELSTEGKPYLVKAFVWNSLGEMQPVCEARIKSL